MKEHVKTKNLLLNYMLIVVIIALSMTAMFFVVKTNVKESDYKTTTQWSYNTRKVFDINVDDDIEEKLVDYVIKNFYNKKYDDEELIYIVAKDVGGYTDPNKNVISDMSNVYCVFIKEKDGACGKGWHYTAIDYDAMQVLEENRIASLPHELSQ